MFNIDNLFGRNNEAIFSKVLMSRRLKNAIYKNTGIYVSNATMLADHAGITQSELHTQLCTELQDIYLAVRKQYPDIQVGVRLNYSNEAHPRHMALYFEGDPHPLVEIQPHDTRRSAKPGYKVWYCADLGDGRIYAVDIQTVNIKKIINCILKKATRIPIEAYHLGAISYSSDEPAYHLRDYTRNKQSTLRNISTEQLLPTMRWLRDNGIVIPDTDLQERFDRVIKAEDALTEVRRVHDMMVAVRDVGNGSIMLAGVTDVLQNGKIQNFAVITPQETPDWLQMRVATLSTCEGQQFIEGVGYRHDKDTFFVVCGDFHE